MDVFVIALTWLAIGAVIASVLCRVCYFDSRNMDLVERISVRMLMLVGTILLWPILLALLIIALVRFVVAEMKRTIKTVS